MHRAVDGNALYNAMFRAMRHARYTRVLRHRTGHTPHTATQDEA